MKTENLPRIITWLSAVLTVVIILGFPCVVFIMSYHNLGGRLQTAVDIKSVQVSNLISANPTTWQLEYARVRDIMSSGIHLDMPAEIHIHNLQGDLLVAIDADIAYPFISRTVDLYDSGLKVGDLQISISMWPLFLETFFVLLITVPIGLGGFIFFRTVPVSEMEWSERELRVSEEKYRDAIESANDAMFTVDPHFNYMDVNKKAVEIFGYSKEEFLTMNIFDVIPSDQLSRSETQFEKLRRKGNYRSFIGKMRTKDGRWLDIEVNSSAIIKDGEFLGSRDIVRDITDRTRIERALLEEKEKLQTYLDTSAVIVVVLNSDETIQLINKKGCDILKCNFEEVANNNWFDRFIPFDKREEVRQVFSHIIRKEIKSAEYYENTVLTAQGEQRLIAWYNSVLVNAEGIVTGILSSGIDITDRRKMREKLQESEARYADAASAANLGHWSHDLITHDVFWSNQIYNILGIHSDKYIPTFEKFLTFVHPIDSGRVKRNIETVISGNDQANIQYRIIRADREERQIDANLKVIVDKQGKAVKLLGTMQDITQQIELEQVKVISEWSQGLAQGVKNSLAGIKVSIELLAEDGQLSESDNEVIQKSIAEIDRIDRTINSLLKFTALRKPQFMRININNILERLSVLAIKNHPQVSLKENLKIVTELDKNVPDFMADPFHLQEAFFNLISNSIEAMPAGGIISLKTRYDKEDGCILLVFSDTGPGVNDTVIKSLFQPFITTKAKGTGLGLAITKRLIEQHQGIIYLESTSDSGSVFHVKFPLKETDGMMTTAR